MKFFHEIPQSEILQIIDEGRDWQYVMDNYAQPEWCSYPGALNGRMGCWSLIDLSEGGARMKISHEFCKGCDCYKLKTDADANPNNTTTTEKQESGTTPRPDNG